MEVSCSGQADVEKLAARLADHLGAGDLVALTGDLGAGKTTFARAFIRACLGDQMAEVPSPTFTLVQTYDTDDCSIYHTDLYRIKEPDEVYDLGLDDDRSGALLLVEWPDRMPEDWWQDALEISLKRPAGAATGEDEARIVSIKGGSDWQSRLTGMKL
ncbi:MAG: tRNA (adenosine(37)-N6)-threonylcarbamoyltransferase complex ATPase subunit type 1 TsaE [Kordiimonas sp.]